MGKKSRKKYPNPSDPETSSQPPDPVVAVQIRVPPAELDKMYKTRRIYHHGKIISILCQNASGPCALLSICNVLVLEGLLKMRTNRDGEVSESLLISTLLEMVVTLYQLMEQIRDNFTLASLSELVPKLVNNFAVNVNFASTSSFGNMDQPLGGEPEAALFAVLAVPLYHGWIIDPEDEELIMYVNGKPHDTLSHELQTYHSYLTQGIDMGDATNKKWTRVGLLLNGKSLTDRGLLSLHEDIEEKKTFVLFWHNHYHTATKLNGHIYLLQTDEGFVGTDAVWKQLDGVNGEGDLLTCFFTPSGETISVDGSELYLMDFLLEPAVLAANLPTNSVHTLYRTAGKMIVSCTDTTKREFFLERLRTEMSKDDLETFYQSVYKMIGDETDNTKGGEYLCTLMETHNQEFSQLAKKINRNPALKEVLAILQMNKQAAMTVGQKFYLQIQMIFPDMIVIHSDYTQKIHTAILEERPVDHLRCVNREVLNLMNSFVEAQDLPNDMVMSLLENPLFTYGNNGYQTREHELISLFSTIVKKCNNNMNERVLKKLTEILKDLSVAAIELFKYPEHCLKFLSFLHAISTECFQVFTEDSCKRLSLVMDFIIHALCETEKEIGFNALHLLYGILEKMKTTELKNGFYRTYFFRIQQNIIKVLMGAVDTYSDFYLLVLKQLFSGISDLTEYIWDVPLEGPEHNTMIIRDSVMKFINTTFPSIPESKAGTFVDGLLNSANDLTNILKQTRQSFVLSSEQLDPAVASRQGVLWRNESTGSSSGTKFRNNMPLSNVASFASAVLPHETDPPLVDWFRHDFLELFTEMDGSLPFYKKEVRSMYINNSKELHIQFSHLLEFDPKWAIKICNFYNRIEKLLKDAAVDFIKSEAGESPPLIDSIVFIVDVPVADSVVLFTEFIKKPGYEIVQDHLIFRGPNSRNVEKTTFTGRKAYDSYTRQLTAAHSIGRTRDGSLEPKYFLVFNNKEFRICKQYAPIAGDRVSNHKDYTKYAEIFIPLFGKAALFYELGEDLRIFFSQSSYSLEKEKQFRLFVRTNLAGKYPLVRSTFWSNLLKGVRSLSPEGQIVMQDILSFSGCVWPKVAKNNPILEEVYNYDPNKKGENDRQATNAKPAEENLKQQTIDGQLAALDGTTLEDTWARIDFGDGTYAPSLGSLLEYLRHGNQHLGKCKHGKKSIQRLIEIDLLLSQELTEMVAIMWELHFSDKITDEIKEMLEDIFYVYDFVEPDPFLTDGSFHM